MDSRGDQWQERLLLDGLPPGQKGMSLSQGGQQWGTEKRGQGRVWLCFPRPLGLGALGFRL